MSKRRCETCKKRFILTTVTLHKETLLYMCKDCLNNPDQLAKAKDMREAEDNVRIALPEKLANLLVGRKPRGDKK